MKVEFRGWILRCLSIVRAVVLLLDCAGKCAGAEKDSDLRVVYEFTREQVTCDNDEDIPNIFQPCSKS
jgi:hypothetical protein